MPRLPITVLARAALLVSGLVFFALLGCAANRGGADGESSAEKEHRETTGDVPVRKECKPGGPTDSIIADPDGSMDKTLVRRADNIFVGRVIGRTGERGAARGGPPLPETSFAVEVERNVKNSLSGTVTVVQAGGCDPRYGRVLLVNDDPLLEPGERAVFSTTEYPPPEDTHAIVGSNYGDMRVETRAQEDRIIARLWDDKREYVPFRPAERPGK